MARSVSLSPLGSEFDDFLYAPIGEEGNGRLLSVVSALARLDVDPWEEAGRLTRLPREIAIQRLASLIAELSAGHPTHRDPATIAARLVALLPRAAGSDIPPHDTSLNTGTSSRAVLQMAFIAFVLIAQCIIGVVESRQMPAPIEGPGETASSQVSPKPADTLASHTSQPGAND